MSQVTASKILNSCAKTAISETLDFFGIASITSKDIAGAFTSPAQLHHEEIKSKYSPLSISRTKLENEETSHRADFASIRYDSDNKPKRHGQFELTNEKLLYETVQIKQQFVPLEHQGGNINNEVESYPRPENVPEYREPYRIIDVKPELSLSEALGLLKNEQPLEDVLEYANKPPLWFNFKKQLPQTTKDLLIKSESPKISQQPEEDTEEIKPEYVRQQRDRLLRIEAEIEEFEPEIDHQSQEQEKLSNLKGFDRSIDEKYDVSYNDQPKNALEYLKHVRSGRIEPTAKGLKHKMQNDRIYSFKSSVKLDSLGFRNYSLQVPDWTKCRRIDALNLIESSILYHNYDILAINKPYGIASHDEREKGLFDVNNLLQEILARKNLKPYLAHRIDKTTTGILLFATSKERATNLNKLFQSDQITKTYWCITRGIPDPDRGIIDMPIGELRVAGKTRSCVVPEGISDDRQLVKKHREARRAITEYKVIQETKLAALVEVKPKTGVKHQIRCHLGFGLNKPILGDHKYSNVSKIVPQTLPVSLLNALHLRQAKVRTLPIHLHAKSIVIPGAKANGETLFIYAPLPSHFKENAKSLGLYKDSIAQEANKGA